jgi:aspartate racemase
MDRINMKKPKHIGIVGCSAEGASLCYRTICEESGQLMGEHFHPEVSMHTHSLGDYMVPIQKGNWKKVADLMLSSTEKLAKCGAEFVICPDNTIHEAFSFIENNSPLPWLHIADVVSKKAVDSGYKTCIILGTQYLMEGPVYPQALSKSGVNYLIPSEEVRKKINTIIFSELVHGNFSETNRLYFNEVIQELKDQGAEAAILGCTEIPLLVDPDDCPLPTLDSTRLLARAAIKHAMQY